MTTLIFGDSIAWGAWDHVNSGWAEMLKKEQLQKEQMVYNLSVSGDCSMKILHRMRAEITARHDHDPHGELKIIFAFGINDASYINGVPRTYWNTFKANIDSIYCFARSRTNDIVFIGPILVDQRRTTPVNWDNDLSYSNEDIMRYNQIIKMYCKNKGVPFINCIELFRRKRHFLMDGLHPHTLGHELLYKHIKKNLNG